MWKTRDVNVIIMWRSGFEMWILQLLDKEEPKFWEELACGNERMINFCPIANS